MSFEGKLVDHAEYLKAAYEVSDRLLAALQGADLSEPVAKYGSYAERVPVCLAAQIIACARALAVTKMPVGTAVNFFCAIYSYERGRNDAKETN